MRKSICIVFAVVCILVGCILANNKIINLESQKAEQSISSITEDFSFKHSESAESNLPIIYIETNGKQIYKDATIWSTISVEYPNLHQAEKPISDFTSTALIKYRGNSSYYNFDKRQFRITFYKKTGSTDKAKFGLFGMGKNSEWVLNAPFLDRSLIRNHLLYGLSKQIMDCAPDSRFCELYNNGVYQGIYLAVEPVGNGERKLRLSDFSLLSGKTAFILERERDGTEDNVIHTYGELNGFTRNELSIQYPTKPNLTSVQRSWIVNYISKFEQVLYGDGFADPIDGYEKYIDIDSFVDYFIINEVSMNSDAGNLSTYCYQELGGKLNLTVWDFNNSYNNYIWDVKEFDEYFMIDSPWFDRLLNDRSFVDRVVERYFELRKTVLSNKNMISYIDNDINYLGDAIQRNFQVWGYTFDEKLLVTNEDGTSRDPRNYEEAVTQLKEAIYKRFLFLDENMDLLYENCIN